MFLKEFLSNTPESLVKWPLLGFTIFVVAFLIVLVRVFFGMRRGEKLDNIASLPLADDDAAVPVDYPKEVA